MIRTTAFRICNWNGKYGEGSFSPDVAFPYIVAVNNVSQTVAMYCLVLFYRANKVSRRAALFVSSVTALMTLSFQNELKPMKPLSKFLCIKAVVFFSYL